MKRIISLFIALIMTAGVLFCFMPAGVSALPQSDKIVIVLDPSGIGQGDRNRDIAMAKYIMDDLEKTGNFEVYLTRSSSTANPTDYQRAAFADSLNADLIVSICFDTSANSLLRGTDAWCSVVSRFALDDLAAACLAKGELVLPELPAQGVYHRKNTSGYFWNDDYQWDMRADPNGTTLSDYYGIINWGAKFGIPAMIINEMYLSNPDDLAIYNNDTKLRTLASAQAQAIAEYYTNHTHTYGQIQADYPLSCISAGKKSYHCTVCGHRKDAAPIADAPNEKAHFPCYNASGWTCVYTDALIKGAKMGGVTLHEGTGAVERVTVELTDAPLPTPEPDPEPKPEPEPTPTPTPTPEPAPSDETDTSDDEQGEKADHEHDFSVFAGGQEALGSNPGFAIYQCTKCNQTKRIDFSHAYYDCSVSGHVPFPDDEHQAVMATCSTEGVNYYYCLACNQDYSETVPALGHDFAVQSEIPATCVTNGILTEQCTVCGTVKTSETPTSDHTFEHQKVEATCTTPGYDRAICSVCAVATETIIPATGHKYELVDEKNAGLFTRGYKVYVCSYCKDQYSETEERTGSGSLFVILPVCAAVLLLVLIFLMIALLRKGGNTNPPEEYGDSPEDDSEYGNNGDAIINAVKSSVQTRADTATAPEYPRVRKSHKLSRNLPEHHEQGDSIKSDPQSAAETEIRYTADAEFANEYDANIAFEPEIDLMAEDDTEIKIIPDPVFETANLQAEPEPVATAEPDTAESSIFIPDDDQENEPCIIIDLEERRQPDSPETTQSFAIDALRKNINPNK